MCILSIGQELDFENSNIDSYDILDVSFGAQIDVFKLTSSVDAANLGDHLVDRGLRIRSVSRIFAIIRAMINLTIGEEELDCSYTSQINI